MHKDRIFMLLAIQFVFMDHFVVHVCLAWSIVFIALKQQKAAGCILRMWEVGCTASSGQVFLLHLCFAFAFAYCSPVHAALQLVWSPCHSSAVQNIAWKKCSAGYFPVASRAPPLCGHDFEFDLNHCLSCAISFLSVVYQNKDYAR